MARNPGRRGPSAHGLLLALAALALGGLADGAAAQTGGQRWVCPLFVPPLEVTAAKAAEINARLPPDAKRCAPKDSAGTAATPADARPAPADVAPPPAAPVPSPQAGRTRNQQFSCSGPTSEGGMVDSAAIGAPTESDARQLFQQRFGRPATCCAHIDRPQDCGSSPAQGLSLFACRRPQDPPLTLNWVTVEAASPLEAQGRMGHRSDVVDPKACVPGPAERQIERIQRLTGGARR